MLVALLVPAVSGQAKDRPGAKDHPLFTRMPGFYIHKLETGTLENNVALSNARAAAVVKALVTRGVAAARLAPFGAGPYAPVTSNRAETGRAKNRRVEMVERP